MAATEREDSPSCVVIRCPQGITVKDVKTFFSKTCTSFDEEITHKAVDFVRRQGHRGLQDVTLGMMCRWGTVQFVAGSGKRHLSVSLEEKETSGFKASITNLAFGCLRLVVAVAALVHGAVTIQTTVRLLGKDWNRDVEILLALLTLRQCWGWVICLLVVLDTVYRPRSLFHDPVGQRSVTKDIVQDKDQASLTPRQEACPTQMDADKQQRSKDDQGGCSQPTFTQSFWKQRKPQRPSCRLQTQRRLERNDKICKQQKLHAAGNKIRRRILASKEPGKPRQLQRLHTEQLQNQQRLRHPCFPKQHQQQQCRHSRRQTYRLRKFLCRLNPTRTKKPATAFSKISNTATNLENSEERYYGRNISQSSVFKTMSRKESTACPITDSPRSLFGSTEWLVRAGLCWFLVSSGSACHHVVEWHSPIGFIGALYSVSGYILFAMGIVSVSVHFFTRSKSHNLLMRWTTRCSGKNRTYGEHSGSVHEGNINIDVKKDDSSSADIANEGRHTVGSQTESSSLCRVGSSCRMFRLCRICATSLVSMLVAFSIAVTCIIVLFWRSPHKSAFSRAFLVAKGSGSHLFRAYQNAPLPQQDHTGSAQTFIANTSALLLCVCVSVKLAVSLVVVTRQKTRKISIALTDILLHWCCVAVMWNADVMMLFQQAVTGNSQDETDTNHFGQPRQGLGFQTAFASLSVVIILIPVFYGLFRLFSGQGLSIMNLRQKFQLLTCNCVASLVQAVAVTLALCSLLLIGLAIPFPWVSLRSSYSRDFQPMAAALRNVSLQLEEYTVAMSTLVMLPVCTEGKMAALLGQVDYSKDGLRRLSVNQIQDYCLEFECSTLTAVNPSQTDNQGYLSLPLLHTVGLLQNNKGQHQNAHEHTSQSVTSNAGQHIPVSNQPGRNQHMRSSLCEKFCTTSSYFKGLIPFNASLHKLLAKEIKGNPVYETLHLKSLLLEEKTKLLSKLERKRTATDDMLRSHAGNFNFDDSDHKANHHEEKVSHTLLSDRNVHIVRQGYTNHEVNHKVNDVSGMTDDSRPVLHRQHFKPSSNNHVSCMQTLCTLEAVSQVGQATPFLGLAFQAVHLAVRAVVVTLKLIMKAEELSVTFDDLRIRLESLALYLEYGVQERVVYLSISSYSMIYLAYPALMVGCLGVLVGFWRRQTAASPCRRNDAILAVVLPLMMLNVLGIAVTFVWSELVQAVNSLVQLLDVTSSPLLGAHFLLAAFTCGACSCALISLLIGWQIRRQHVQSCDSGQCVNVQSDLLQGAPNVAHQNHCKTTQNDFTECASNVPRSYSPKQTLTIPESMNTPNYKKNARFPESQDLPGQTSQNSDSFSLGQTHRPLSCPAGAVPFSSRPRSFSTAHKLVPRGSTRSLPPDSGPYSAGSSSLTLLLTLIGCGLMIATLWIPVFYASVTPQQQFATLLAQMEQDSAAATASRHVLLSEGQGSCDVIEVIGKEVVAKFLSTLQTLQFRPLVTELRVLREKAEQIPQTVQSLILAPCLVTAVISLLLVLFGIITQNIIQLKSRSHRILTSKGTAQALRRLSLLSLAWLLHTSLLMIGPVASVAAPAVVEVTVVLGSGFGVAVAAHVLLLLASLELRLSVIAPLT